MAEKVIQDLTIYLKVQLKIRNFHYQNPEFEKWCTKFPHGLALIEIRSGSGQQSLGPGSKIGTAPGTGEEVKWDVLEGISIYDGDVFEDVSKIAFATALTILYPSVGSQRDYCYAIACILAKGTDWTDSEIDRIIEKISENSGVKISDKLHVGTHARKQIKAKGRLNGFSYSFRYSRSKYRVYC